MSEDDAFRRRVGATLRGKWVLDRLLGVGGMAAVYAATHKIGRREAIKILHDEVAGSRELVERFEQEAHAANRFRHPGAVEVRDHDVTEDGAPFLVMELLEGESLGQRVMREAVPLGDALRYADELLDVLAAAHAQGIVHRDVKPDNLFVTRDGRLKVLDFGIARMLEGSPRSARTAVGLAMGTPQYMPPEQVLGSAVDHRADLYAVGATLFRLVAGRHVHEGPADASLLVKVMTEPAPPLCSIAPGAPAPLGLVVDRALSLRPEDRYPDARTMQLDVQALRRGEAPPFASAHAPGRAPAGVAGGPAPLGYAPTAVARPAAPPGGAPTAVATPRAATGHALAGPSAQAARGATSAFEPTSPRAATGPGAAFAVVPPLADADSTRAWAVRSGKRRTDRRTAYVIAMGALALLTLLFGGLWFFGGDSSGGAADLSPPGPGSIGDAPPGTDPGSAGKGPGPTSPPRAGPSPVGKPPGLRREREKELERQREREKERQKELEKERERQREREKEGRKK